MSIKLKIVPWLEPLIDELWKNKSGCLKLEEGRHGIKKQVLYFDYPDYAGLSEDLINQLDDDIVDLLQNILEGILKSAKTKSSFAKMIASTLTNGIVFVK